MNDSVHIVGRQGGMIINQNPKSGSLVKENRKIYVTVTKYNPDKLTLKDLPVLYGADFEQKRKEQVLYWMHERIREGLKDSFYQKPTE